MSDATESNSDQCTREYSTFGRRAVDKGISRRAQRNSARDMRQIVANGKTALPVRTV
jgi:hypothetical protein